MNKIISFDIGGTGCQWIKFDNLSIVKRGEFSTKGSTKARVLQEIANIIDAEYEENLKVGISSPTAVNLETGYAYGLSGIEGYGNFNLYDELKQLIQNQDIKIKATNDANAALLGSLYFAEGKYQNAVLASLGTGVGGAIYLNNQIITGKDGFAGEFGYGMLMHENLNVSQNLSTIALTRLVKEQTGQEMTGKEIWSSLDDPKINAIVNKWIDNNARFFAFLTYSFNPEAIFIGGGISSNKEFIDKLTLAIQAELRNYNVEKIMPEILPAKGGGDAGIYGAMSLWLGEEK